MQSDDTDVMAAIAAQIAQRKAPNAGNSQRNRLINPYTIPQGTALVGRMVPSPDGSLVTVPWLDWYTRRFPFVGVVGADTDSDDEQVVIVTADQTYGLPSWEDPISRDTKPLWNTNRDLARIYYPRRDTLIPCLVVSSPVADKIECVDKVRVLKSGPQLTKAFEARLVDYDAPVWSYTDGRDFTVPVGTQGGFRNYSGAGFKGRVRVVPEADRPTLEELPNLMDIIGPQASDEVRKLTWELYLSSRRGEPFDNQRFGKHFRVFPTRANGGGANTAAQLPSHNGGSNGGAEPLSEEDRQHALDLVGELRGKVSSRTVRTTAD